MSIIDELITDRTQSDVTHWQELHDKGWAGMTDDEKAEWNTAAMKGAYNYTDLNRVIAAMDYLDEVFTRYGYETGYRKIFVRNTSGLPDGYTKLEYLQSSGTQYIDTGVYPNQDTRVVCDVELLESGRAYGIFGSRIGYGNTAFDVFAFGLNSTQDFQDDYNKQSNAPLASSISKFLIDKNKNLTVINGVESIFSQSTFSVQYPMYLFGVNTSGTPNNQLGDLRVFSCQIYDNGTIVHNFVPCKDKNGLIGLYDTVEQRVYLNAGTGSFVAGPETVDTGSSTPYTWTESDVPTASQMSQYIANINALRGTIAVLSTTPATPKSMELLDYIKANDIEKILVDINQLIINMAAAWFYSGEVYSGEVDT